MSGAVPATSRLKLTSSPSTCPPLAPETSVMNTVMYKEEFRVILFDPPVMHILRTSRCCGTCIDIQVHHLSFPGAVWERLTGNLALSSAGRSRCRPCNSVPSTPQRLPPCRAGPPTFWGSQCEMFVHFVCHLRKTCVNSFNEILATRHDESEKWRLLGHFLHSFKGRLEPPPEQTPHIKSRSSWVDTHLWSGPAVANTRPPLPLQLKWESLIRPQPRIYSNHGTQSCRKLHFG